MSRTRLYIDCPLTAESEIELTGEQARYVGRALRLGAGDALIVFNGRGGEYAATIGSVRKHHVRLAIGDRIDRDVESPLHIHLLQGISRGDRMDTVVQKATELGVQKITPVVTDHSVVKLEPARAEKRLQHWQGIGRSACEQSGRNRLPAIDAPLPLRTWIGENAESPGMRLILKPGAAGSLQAIDATARRLIVLIGPEGGFSGAEYELAESVKFSAIGFGRRILRTETAAIAAVAALQAMYGDLAIAAG